MITLLTYLGCDKHTRPHSVFAFSTRCKAVAIFMFRFSTRTMLAQGILAPICYVSNVSTRAAYRVELRSHSCFNEECTRTTLCFKGMQTTVYLLSVGSGTLEHFRVVHTRAF